MEEARTRVGLATFHSYSTLIWNIDHFYFPAGPLTHSDPSWWSLCCPCRGDGAQHTQAAANVFLKIKQNQLPHYSGPVLNINLAKWQSTPLKWCPPPTHTHTHTHTAPPPPSSQQQWQAGNNLSNRLIKRCTYTEKQPSIRAFLILRHIYDLLA